MQKELICDNWRFYKGVADIGAISGEGERVNLPHTWNNYDGQDGGNDYYRGKCFYLKTIALDKEDGAVYYLQFDGVNAVSEVYVNGALCGEHRGGFSKFRFNITDKLICGENTIAVSADNSVMDDVYPQMADFTFFGGIYRNVYLIRARESRFNLDYYAGDGVAVTPMLNENGSADIKICSYITNINDCHIVRARVYEGVKLIAEQTGREEMTIRIEEAKLWDGVKSPFLYKVRVTLEENGEEIDMREIETGIRSFRADAQEGFFLNGRSYPLRGVSRHQDRQDMGWAIGEREHIEDMSLIREVGANTVRLAHYQHDEFFYSLADRAGMVVWAEIPFISSYMRAADKNAEEQMTELIVQNYNHPSICFWGISNEITMGGESAELLAIHERLNGLCHSLDSTRLTTMANLSMLEMDSPMLRVSDITAYNHYFGWYMGDVADNADWLDNFRREHPDIAIGISEYGAEAVTDYHTALPEAGDYTEEYQAYYHEKMLEIFDTRPYLWATYVWNMFDFAADSRDEGGVKGRNNKGLVTYDRRRKKDSFYLYKAYWSGERVLHIAGKRFKKRSENPTKIKVYSNIDAVSLYANGKFIETKRDAKVYEFSIPFDCERLDIEARAAGLSDSVTLYKTEKPYEGYILKEGGNITNWFEKDGSKKEFKFPEGKLSVRDKISVINRTEQGRKLIEGLIGNVTKSGAMSAFKITPSMLKMLGNMTLERIAGMAGDNLDRETLYEINEKLNKINKE